MDSFMTNQGYFHIGAKIFKNLDFKTQLTCRLVKRSWNQFLEYEASKSKIDFNALLRMLEEPDPKNYKEYEYLVKEVNYQKWTKFLLKMEAKIEIPWINALLQKYIKYMNRVGLSIFPLEYFVLIRNAKMVEFIFKEKLVNSFHVRQSPSTLLFLKIGASFTKQEFGHALHQAVRNGDSEIVKHFKPFLGPHHLGSYVFRPARENDLKTLKILFPNPREPLVVDYEGSNPIHIAARNGHIEIVKYFIENSEGLTVQNKLGHTPFLLRCFHV